MLATRAQREGTHPQFPQVYKLNVAKTENPSRFHLFLVPLKERFEKAGAPLESNYLPTFFNDLSFSTSATTSGSLFFLPDFFRALIFSPYTRMKASNNKHMNKSSNINIVCFDEKKRKTHASYRAVSIFS